MIEIWKLTKKHINSSDLPYKYKQIITFATSIGHGVGTIDFNEKIAVFSDEEWESFLNGAKEYAKFKLGNLNLYFEIEILKEHAKLLIKEIKNSPLKDILSDLDEGYIIIKKIQT